MTFKFLYWKSHLEKSAWEYQLVMSWGHIRKHWVRTKYVWCTRDESVVGGLLYKHWNNSRNTLPWMESVRFLTGVISGAFQYSADILCYLKASHRDDEENIDLHEPCRWWSESLPFRFFQFSRDLTWRPLLSFPLLSVDLEPLYHAEIKIMGQIWGYWVALFSKYRSPRSSDLNRNNRINNNNNKNRHYNEYPPLIQSSMPHIV